jgi:GrpB-like predicted nucleotidyltransferase (UPF0157 family)
MQAPIVIVDYDPRWPEMFRAERDAILSATGPRLVAIEHVGSTAVPGLGAKPIIDIMAGVRRLAEAAECIAPLAPLGYRYLPEYEALIPDRRFFRKGPPGPITHHLHLVELGGDFWERHLLFRDYLRTHPEAAEAYYQLKRQMAARFSPDRNAYTDSKTQFIRSVEDRARRERGDGAR